MWKPNRPGAALFIVAAVLAVVFATFAYRHLVVASRQLEAVEVTWTAPLRCEGTEVFHRRTGMGGARVQAMRLRTSMDCTLPVRVVNHGSDSVRIEGVVVPYMGPGGGAPVQVEQLDGKRPQGRQDRRGPIDAVFPVRRELEPGDRFDFAMRFTFRPGGCNAGLLTVGAIPRVRVTALSRTAVLSTGERLGFGTSPDADCST